MARSSNAKKPSEKKAKTNSKASSAKKAASGKSGGNAAESYTDYSTGIEIAIWLMVLTAVLLTISNFGLGGKIGDMISGFLFGVMGAYAYLFPFIVVFCVCFGIANKGDLNAVIKLCGGILLSLCFCMFLSLLQYDQQISDPIKAYEICSKSKIGGGIIGAFIVHFSVPGFGKAGSYAIDLIFAVIAVVIITGKSLIRPIRSGSRTAYDRFRENRQLAAEAAAAAAMEESASKIEPVPAEKRPARRTEKVHLGVSLDAAIPNKNEAEETVSPVIETYPSAKQQLQDLQELFAAEFSEPEENQTLLPEEEKQETTETRSRSKKSSRPKPAPTEEEKQQMEAELSAEAEAAAEEKETLQYVHPHPDLLTPASTQGSGNARAELMATAEKLTQTLMNFGVDAKVTSFSRGPAVTRFEITPAIGVKVSKIVSLADDIKLNLAAADIRIEAPIPGKSAVGIEVPNISSSTVYFRELIESREFSEADSPVSFALGKDIGGNVKIANIAKMPHLLIAGATGSGKSVCINTIIMSILYKADPADVQLIMIDPKVVELSVYNGIPHLMFPVVTDPKKATGVLGWAVNEMTRRYSEFAEHQVRDINGYNRKVESGEILENGAPARKLPLIVIIVDELADLMMVASKEVEEYICRLAQLARAAGLHLIIATQRPSVNVITGLIKANMPSRIAFAVTSGTDSRTILDMNGAEKLLGKGDMLFDPQGAPKPLRMQGAFVSDTEVQNVVDFIKENNVVSGEHKEMQEKIASAANAAFTGNSFEDTDSGKDEYFAEAGRIITDKEKASIGMLQRYLKIGFNRAARIMDQLEDAGVVGPEEGTKPRSVLMSSDDFDQYLRENG